MGRVIMSGVVPLLTAPVPPPPPCLTFSSPNSFTVNVATPGWDGMMEYSTDKTTWTTWDGSQVTATDNGGTYVLYLRGTGNTKATGGSSNKWTLTGTNIACVGNIECLLDYATVAAGNHPEMTAYCYGYMFYGCTGLTTIPALPATTLSEGCYEGMFYSCTGLTTIPALPATTLPEGCYAGMFCGCTSLKLSATQTGTYTQAYRIPTSGSGVTGPTALYNMFTSTGGTFTGEPEIGTTYYLDASNTIIS